MSLLNNRPLPFNPDSLSALDRELTSKPANLETRAIPLSAEHHTATESGTNDFIIIGDPHYIPSKYAPLPPWLQTAVEAAIDQFLTTKDSELVDTRNILQEAVQTISMADNVLQDANSISSTIQTVVNQYKIPLHQQLLELIRKINTLQFRSVDKEAVGTLTRRLLGFEQVKETNPFNIAIEGIKTSSKGLLNTAESYLTLFSDGIDAFGEVQGDRVEALENIIYDIMENLESDLEAYRTSAGTVMSHSVFQTSINNAGLAYVDSIIQLDTGLVDAVPAYVATEFKLLSEPATTVPFYFDGGELRLYGNSLSAGSVHGKHVQDNSITADKILDGSIPNIAVFDDIHSDNWDNVVGTGWILKQDGTSILNGVSVTGTIQPDDPVSNITITPNMLSPDVFSYFESPVTSSTQIDLTIVVDIGDKLIGETVCRITTPDTSGLYNNSKIYLDGVVVSSSSTYTFNTTSNTHVVRFTADRIDTDQVKLVALLI